MTRRFGAVVALDGVDLTTNSGQVTCVLGPNGAGKTTGMEIAAGLQPADAGQVRVLGVDPWQAGPAHRARVGVMLQDGGLPQAVRPVPLLRHLASFWREPVDVDELAQRLGLAEFPKVTIRRLSGGQRQRVALAAALIGRPTVAFLDEPTAGLDPHARREVHAIITETARAGVGVMVTTHSFEEAERLADKIVVICDGKVAASGSPADVAGATSLEETYFRLTDGSHRSGGAARADGAQRPNDAQR